MDLKKPDNSLASRSPLRSSCKYEDLIDLEDELHELNCEKLPSSCKCKKVSWIWAIRPTPQNQKRRIGGKWLLFPKNRPDEIWEKVKILLAADRLATSAKISLKDDDGFVICVYTHDYEDVEDVFRVLVALRRNRLQLRRSINYKTDEASSSGIYRDEKCAKRAGFDSNKERDPGEKVCIYTTPPYPSYDPTGATEKIQMFKNNIGPEYKSGLVAELVKYANDTEPKITFYNPPRIVESNNRVPSTLNKEE